MKKILVTIGVVFIIIFGLLYIIFPPCNTEGWFRIIQVAITGAGFAGALSSLNIALNRAQRNKSQEGVSLFDKFIDEKMRDIRRDAWKVKLRWENELGYKEKILRLYSKNSRTNRSEEEENQLYEFFKVMQLMAFYDMLSLHEQHAKIIIRLKYFYYDWWRKFLYEVASELDGQRMADISLPKEYLENTFYTSSLKKLDRLLGFDKVPEDKELIIHKDSNDEEKTK